MKFKFRQQFVDLLYDTPMESFARSAYMFMFQHQNFKTDKLTAAVLEKVLKEHSNCIDIGCYRGEILRHMLKLSPKGRIFAFEPTPYHYTYLTGKFPTVSFHQVALGNECGRKTFHYNKSHPARSSLRYDSGLEDAVEEIDVEVNKLDNLIPEEINIDFIKIDVEGAEYMVIAGGMELIKRSRPVIIFEHGGDAAGGYTPDDLYGLLSCEIGLQVSTMDRWLANRPALDRKTFVECVMENVSSDFIAY